MKTYVAFTSDSRPLYYRDVLNSLCCPAGWSVRFTYRRVWVTDREDAATAELWRRLGRNDLEGSAVLIVFCRLAADGASYESVVPVRSGSIVLSRVVGDVAEINIKLGRWPSRKLAEGFAATFPEAGRRVPSLGPAPQNYFFVGPYDVADLDGEEMEWDLHAKALAQSSRYPGGVVVRLRHFSATDFRGSLSPIRTSTSPAGLTVLQLPAGELYQAEFYVPEDFAKGLTQSPITMTAAGEDFLVAEPVISQYGEGATVAYYCRTSRQFAPTVISLVAQGKAAAASDTGKVVVGPQFQAVAVIAPPRRFWLLTFTLLTLAALALNVNSDALRFLSGVTDQKNLDASLFVFRVLGGIGFALIASYVLRRLPIKIT